VVRLGSLAPPLACLALLAACTTEIVSDNLVGLSPEEAAAQTLWVNKAMPIFAAERTGCIRCHDGSMPTAPAYLAGEDELVKRETLVAFVPRVVNLAAPGSSRMLTVGDHTMQGGGPALFTSEQTDILQWINIEKRARPQPEAIRTAQLTPMLCTGGNPGDPTCPLNTIDLNGIGPTPTAATFELAIQQVGSDSYFTALKVKAGAAGVYLEHPLFESWPADATEPKPDPIDRFFATVINLQPNTEMIIGTGTATMSTFVATDPISVRVDVIEPYRPGT
jgi:hypothetical protein